MSTVRDILERRRSEIRKQSQPLEAEAAQLRSKLADLDARLKTLSREENDIQRALAAMGRNVAAETTITIKDAILDVLAVAPQGLTSNELLTALNDRFFEGTLVRTSMSPQIARLKNKDHKIRQRGDRYFLA